MAAVLYATNRYPGDGTTTTFPVAFSGGYIDKAHVVAFITDALGARTDLTLTPGMWVTPTSINLGVPVAVGSTLTLARNTPKTGSLVDYTNGTRLTESNLDLANKQAVFIGAEAHDLFDTAGVEDAIAAAEADVTALVATAAGHASAAAGSAATATAQAGIATTGASTSTAQASIATAQAGVATSKAADAALSANLAATSQVNTQAIADAVAAAGVGWNAAAYDFGVITDTGTYFDRDFGTLP